MTSWNLDQPSRIAIQPVLFDFSPFLFTWLTHAPSTISSTNQRHIIPASMLAVSSSKPAEAALLGATSRSCSYGSSAHAVSPSLVTSFKSALDAANAQVPAASTSSSSAFSSANLPKSMVVNDRIYGSFAITEVFSLKTITTCICTDVCVCAVQPVLIDLLHSEPIDRLRSVLQHGITGLIGLTPQPAVTRYEHSVGAMLLVRAAGGSIEAQASALLHDIAHTALSHVIDGVFGYVVHEDDKMEHL